MCIRDRQQGTVKLINGVAIHRAAQNPHSTLPEYNLDYEVLHFGDRKARIGKKAASLIEPNDVIAIDTGSTCSTSHKICPAAST